MKQVAMRFGQRGVHAMMPGAALWVVLAALGGLYAMMAGRPALPVIVTLDEWVAAVFFLGPLAGLMLSINRSNGVRRQTGADRFVSIASRLGWAAVSVFLLDLVIRACFGLGWKPF